MALYDGTESTISIGPSGGGLTSLGNVIEIDYEGAGVMSDKHAIGDANVSYKAGLPDGTISMRVMVDDAVAAQANLREGNNINIQIEPGGATGDRKLTGDPIYVDAVEWEAAVDEIVMVNLTLLGALTEATIV